MTTVFGRRSTGLANPRHLWTDEVRVGDQTAANATTPLVNPAGTACAVNGVSPYTLAAYRARVPAGVFQDLKVSTRYHKYRLWYVDLQALPLHAILPSLEASNKLLKVVGDNDQVIGSYQATPVQNSGKGPLVPG